MGEDETVSDVELNCRYLNKLTIFISNKLHVSLKLTEITKSDQRCGKDLSFHKLLSDVLRKRLLKGETSERNTTVSGKTYSWWFYTDIFLRNKLDLDHDGVIHRDK